MKEHDINFNGIPLTIEGVYYKGYTYDNFTPDDPHEFDCHKISANGIDITDLIDSDTITEIENQVLTENY